MLSKANIQFETFILANNEVIFFFRNVKLATKPFTKSSVKLSTSNSAQLSMNNSAQQFR